MAAHDKEALELFESGLSYRAIAERFGLTEKAINHAILRARKAKRIEYEDKKAYTEEDVENFIKAMISLQEKREKLNTKQVQATIRLNEGKPVGVAYWGDWHIGAAGTNYKMFEQDLRKIRDTEGLYFIGAGDFKDNYISGTHVGAQFEQVIQPGMQDVAVKHYFGQVSEKCLALVRGCHDDWDRKQGDKDFLETLCDITDSVNLWHGGELTIKLGDQSYFWRCRHRYKYQSSLNLENAMRRIMETQGPCDVAAEAHLHNGYVMKRYMMGEYRIMLRCGTYKIWDEFGQKLAGYKGEPAVPVVIMFPDRHTLIGELFLDDAIEILRGLRSGLSCT